MEKREVGFWDLITDFLLRWRRIIVFFLLGALLGAVLGGVVNYLSYNERVNNVAEAKTTLAEYDEKLETGEEVDETELQRLQNVVEKGVGKYSVINVRYIVSGSVVAVLIFAVFFFMFYVTNDKIKITDEWNELYNVPQLGVVCKQKKQESFTKRIDKFFWRLKGKKEFELSEIEALKLTYVSLMLLVKKESCEEVFLVGCGIKGFSQHVCEQLKGALEREGISVVILNELFYDAHVMNKLNYVENAVLVAKAGTTTYKEAYNAIELLNRLEIRILGGIITE